MKKILKKISGIFLVVATIIIWCIYSYEQGSVSAQVSTSAISNTKIGWGVKRASDHKQPDLGKINTELMEKYDRYIYGK